MPASARLQDQNGYLFVKGCPIASSGVFQYSAAQVGLPGDLNRIVNVYRPPEAVADEEYLASLQVIPLINDHEMLSGFQGDNSATAPEAYGVDGVLFDVLYAAPWVRGDLKIFSRSMQADLSSGKKDLSLGYTCDFEIRSIVVDGVQCEVIQTNMRGNHIALVEVGRVPGARVLDGKRLCFDALSFSTFSLNGGFTMPTFKRKALDADVAATFAAQLQALLPTFEALMAQGTAVPAAGAAGDPAAAQAAPAAAQPAAAAPAQAAAPAAAATDPNAASAATAAPAAAAGETGTGEVAAEGASAGGAGDPATGAATGSAEGEEDGGDPNEIMKQICALVQQLQAAMGGGQAEAAPAAAAAPAQAAPAKKEGEGGDMGGEATGGEGGAATGGEAGAATTGEGNGATEDTVEGLEATVREGADEGGDPANAGGEGGQGTASAGPSAGKHTGADAALRNFYADAARKTSLVDRLRKVVGTFDGALDLARATASDVAAYGVTKLKLKCAKGQEVVALDAYLSGLEAARGATGADPTQSVSTQAADHAEPDSVVSAYLQKVSK